MKTVVLIGMGLNLAGAMFFFWRDNYAAAAFYSIWTMFCFAIAESMD